MPRPRKQIDQQEIRRLKSAGHSLRDIASSTGLGLGTVQRVAKCFGTAPRRSKTASPPAPSFGMPAEITIDYVKRWRQQEFEAGRPSGLQDFFASHGIARPMEGATHGAPA
jgi:hypothetical protein